MEKMVQCAKCGWVHFSVSADYVRKWLQDWIEYWPKLTDQDRANYGLYDGPPNTHSYLHCFNCHGSYKDMMPATKTVEGSTIQPILAKDEEL